MAFPESYNKVYYIILPSNEGLLFKDIYFQRLKKNININEINQNAEVENSLIFNSTLSLFHFEYQVQINVEVFEEYIKIKYNFTTLYLFAIAFLALLAAFVFTHFTFGMPFILSTLLIFFFYFINIEYIKKKISNILKNATENTLLDRLELDNDLEPKEQNKQTPIDSTSIKQTQINYILKIKRK